VEGNEDTLHGARRSAQSVAFSITVKSKRRPRASKGIDDSDFGLFTIYSTLAEWHSLS